MKKIIGYCAVAGLACAAFFANNNDHQSSNVNLANLLTINKANAECINAGGQWLNDGFCSPFGNCYYNGPGGNCDNSQ